MHIFRYHGHRRQSDLLQSLPLYLHGFSHIGIFYSQRRGLITFVKTIEGPKKSHLHRSHQCKLIRCLYLDIVTKNYIRRNNHILSQIATLSYFTIRHIVGEMPDFAAGSYFTAFVNDRRFVCKKRFHQKKE